MPSSPTKTAPEAASTATPYGALNNAADAAPSAKPLALPASVLTAPVETTTEMMLPWPLLATSTVPAGPTATPYGRLRPVASVDTAPVATTTAYKRLAPREVT